MKIEIKSRWFGEVLFAYECAQNDLMKTIKAAFEAKADLRDADLRGANLYGANLYGANLRDANLGEEYGKLIGDRPVFTIGPIGSRNDVLMCFIAEKGTWLRAGCFFGSIKQFQENLKAEHGDNKHAEEYEAALALILKHVKLWSVVEQPPCAAHGGG